MPRAPRSCRLFANIALGACLAACGLTRAEPRPPADDVDRLPILDGGPAAEGATVATPGCGSLRNNDCAKGLTCFGPSACGSRWTCQKEQPCSAAGPRLGCSCDGRIVSIAAGCPERNAYGLWEAFGLDGTATPGAACDPTRSAPFAAALQIEGKGFDTYDGGRVWVKNPRSDAGAEPLFPAEGIAIANGRFAWASAPQPRADGRYYSMLLDKNGNGRCDPGEDMAFAGGPDEVDALGFVLRWVVTPTGVGAFAAAQMSYCEEWR
jgi:hypothetical protein